MQDDLYHIDRTLNGSKGAFNHLVNKYQNYVFTVSYRVLKNRELAEEAAQDTFVKAYRTLRSFNQQSKFSTWLYRIAQNTAIDYTRKKRHLTDSIDRENAFFELKDTKIKGSFEQMQAIQRNYYIEQIIQQLPTDDAILITHFYLKELSIDEITEITTLSKANIKVKLYRLRKKMRTLLEHLLKDEAKELL